MPEPKPSTWIDEYVEWAMKRSPLTPKHFHQNIALALAAGAIAGRCYVQLPHETIYPNLYILIVSKTTVFGKTTAFNRAREIIQLTMPEKIITEISTPEAFVSTLAGTHPVNMKDLTDEQQKLWKDRAKWGARRLYVLDEAGRLFNLLKRDYASDLGDIMMALYDPMNGVVSRSTRGTGAEIVDRYALSCLFATTPAGIRNVLSSSDAWQSGFWVRWNFVGEDTLTPWVEGKYAMPPQAMIETLRNLSKVSLEKYNEKPMLMSVEDKFVKAFNEATRLLREEVDTMDEERLHGIVGRLPIAHTKAAMIYAMLEGSNKLQYRHWEMAEHFAIGWRRDAQRVIDMIQKTERMGLEERAHRCMFGQVNGVTVRDLGRYLHISSEDAFRILENMKRSGEAYTVESSGKAIRWKLNAGADITMKVNK